MKHYQRGWMLPFFVSLCVWSAFWLTNGKRYSSLLLIPLVMSGYFTLGTKVFSFAENVPFGMYWAGYSKNYALVQYYILLHFACLALAIVVGDALTKPFARRCKTAEQFTGIERKFGWPSFLLCLSPALLVVYAVGISELLARNHFVPQFDNRSFMRFADMLFWLSAIVTPFLQRRTHRFLCLISVVLVFALLGSRSAPVMLMIYILLDRFVVSNRAVVAHVALLLVSLVLMAVLLAVRSQGEGGLAAILTIIHTLEFNNLMNFFWFGINYLTSFSIVVNAEMLRFDDAQWQFFLYSISPLPSFLSDMTSSYDSATRFRVNIPYPGFGYAINAVGAGTYGVMIFCLYFVIQALRNIVVTRRDFIESALYHALIFLPFLLSLQYNLRTSARLFYLLLGVYFLVAGARRLQIK